MIVLLKNILYNLSNKINVKNKKDTGIENYFENYCRKCSKSVHCCIFEDKSSFAFIGIKDAKIIKNKINKNYKDFLDYSPFPKKLINQLKKEDPLLEGALRYNQLDKDNRLLRLKTKQEGRCIFLKNDGKCEIYKIRPNICRIYPYWAIKLNNGKVKVVSHDEDSGCGVIKSRYKKNINKDLSEIEIKDIKETFKNIIKEDKVYRKNIKKFVDKEKIKN